MEGPLSHPSLHNTKQLPSPRPPRLFPSYPPVSDVDDTFFPTSAHILRDLSPLVNLATGLENHQCTISQLCVTCTSSSLFDLEIPKRCHRRPWPTLGNGGHRAI